MGLKNEAVLARYKRIMLPSTVNPAFPTIAGGNGIWVFDDDGKMYVDMNSQVGQASIGHRHPMVVQALRAFLEEPEAMGGAYPIAIIGSDYVHELEVELCEKLAEITPGDFRKKVWLDVAGAQAISSAINFLRHVRPDRPYFISSIGGFHGRDDAARQLTCSKYVQKRHCDRSGYFYKVPFIKVDAIRNLIGSEFRGKEINAVVLEPIQGEGGIEPAKFEEIEELKEFCAEFDIKIVADEIQTGLGRTGKMWASEHYNLFPDILVTSKGLGSGLPISAFIVNIDAFTGSEAAEIKLLPLGWDSLTFMGPPLSCVAALATIKAIEKKDLVKNADIMGELMRNRLECMSKKMEKTGLLNLVVKGLGLMQGLEFRKNGDMPDPIARDRFIKLALDQGLLFMGAGRGKPEMNPTVRFMPPLCINEEQMNYVMNVVDKVLSHSHP